MHVRNRKSFSIDFIFFFNFKWSEYLKIAQKLHFCLSCLWTSGIKKKKETQQDLFQYEVVCLNALLNNRFQRCVSSYRALPHPENVKVYKAGHYPSLCLAPGSQKRPNDVTLPISPPAVAQSIVARETSD